MTQPTHLAPVRFIKYLARLGGPPRERTGSDPDESRQRFKKKIYKTEDYKI